MYDGQYSGSANGTAASDYESPPNHFGSIIEKGIAAGFGVALCKQAIVIECDIVQALGLYENLHEWEDGGRLLCWRFNSPISPEDRRLALVEGYLRIYETKGFPFYQGLPSPIARFPLIEHTGMRIDLDDQRHRHLFQTIEEYEALQQTDDTAAENARGRLNEAFPGKSAEQASFDQDGTPAASQHGVTNIINDEWQRDLPMGQKFLYFALLRHCGNKKNWCIVSEETLAGEIGAAVRSVRRYMNGDACTPDDCLTGRGLVKITPHKFKNMHRYELPEWREINFKKLRAVARRK
jgi:hypothetical protein